MKNVLVVFGGQSVEHDISILTGQFVIAALKATGQFTPYAFYIARDGKWYSDPSLLELETFKRADLDEHLNKLKSVSIKSENGLNLSWPAKLSAKTQAIDVAFPSMHGTYGEDGSLMGLLRLAGVPFVGCDLEASVIAMDKVLTKQVTEAAGVPSVPYVWFNASDYSKRAGDIKEEIAKLSLPWFVKPAHLGSSIGITRVERKADLEAAIEVALHYDDKVIVEQGVTKLMEVNCALMGNGELVTSELEQPLHKSQFLSFEDKYMSGGKKGGAFTGAKSSIKIPAPLNKATSNQVKELAKLAFTAIGGSGFARLDFLVDESDEKVYLNEVNPLPGTLQQHLWKASGVSNVQLVTRLVELAEARFVSRKKVKSVFNSSVLNTAQGAKAAE